MSKSAKVENESERSVTVSSVPRSGEARVSTTGPIDDRRGPFDHEQAPAWLDRLLLAVCNMPAERGESAVVEFLVRSLGDIYGGTAGVGACLVSAPGAPSQQHFKVLPVGEQLRGEGMDPTRLFPGYAFERVLTVEASGSTLHVGSDDHQLENDDSAMMLVAQRAALAMGRGLVHARSQAKATEDARDLRALNSHMAQAEKLASLGQIAAGVVHELNNPLTSIVAYTDWLIRKAGPTGDPDSLERLRRIGESASRILRFTRDLVAYARPSSEVPVLVSVHHVIDQALAFCEHILAEHGATIERKFGASIPQVRGMPEQLAQVFVNLFTNACHALPSSGGKLVLTTEAAASRVVVTVEDNGHGIAANNVSSIFTPFFTTKGEGRGTGLGLSIVKNILDNHGAEIRAEAAEHGGARFVLVFPV